MTGTIEWLNPPFRRRTSIAGPTSAIRRSGSNWRRLGSVCLCEGGPPRSLIELPTRIPLVMLMFLEGETQERLAILAKDPTATFRA